eukprot:g3908.t1 g3908   contig13:459416-461377(-)
MAGSGTPRSARGARNFTYDDALNAPTAPKTYSSPHKLQSQSTRTMVSPSTMSQENVISPSMMKKRIHIAGKHQHAPGSGSPVILRSPPRNSTPRGADGKIAPLSPSSRDTVVRRDSRDDTAAARKRESGEQVRSPRSGSSPSAESAAAASPRSRRSSRSVTGADVIAAASAARAAKRQQEKQMVASSSNNTSSSNTKNADVDVDVDDSNNEDTLSPLPNKHINDNDNDSPRTKFQKQLFNNLRTPDASLNELLSVLTDERTSSSGHHAARRVNACGAIKTLTLNKANQVALARTEGVVASITSVLCHVEATEEERTRCINALMHLCVPEKNWRIVYMFPQTPEALARNMADRYPQIRYAACLALSFLAKKNRKEVVVNRILMYSIARVLEVDKNGALERVSVQDKKVFVGSRLCALKMMLHLSKNKDVSVQLAKTECIPAALVQIANKMEVAANILCIAIMTNLTRHPENSVGLCRIDGLVSVLVSHIMPVASNNDGSNGDTADNQECAKCALYALQNLSCTGSIRQELANTPNLLAALTKNAFKTQHPEQQLSALHSLKNLSDDPFNLVTMTNTPGCTATLLALANDGTNAMAQYLACDTLATLSHWLLTLSAAKTRRKIEKDGGLEDRKEEEEDKDLGRRTFQTLTWEMWA